MKKNMFDQIFFFTSKKRKTMTMFTGKLAEYDKPMNLMKREESMFRKLLKEYWSHSQSGDLH